MRSPFRLMLFLLFILPVAGQEPAAGKQVEQSLDRGDKGSVPYLLYLPQDYGQKDQQWPLMLFLHGRGESDGDLSVVATWGPPRWVNLGTQYPYIIASPQCPSDTTWDSDKEMDNLLALLDYLQNSFKVDEDRIYVTGLSMGGDGSLHLAAEHRNRFAAVLAISGGGDTADAHHLKWMPIWIFHGEADDTVSFSLSVKMVEALKENGNTTVRFTPLSYVGHDAWNAAYALPEPYDWLDAQTASANRKREEDAANQNQDSQNKQN